MADLLVTNDVSKIYNNSRSLFGKKTKQIPKGVINANIEILQGETVGLVGESGSGKSTLGRLALGLDRPDTGDVSYKGVNLSSMNRAQYKEFRRSVQPIFQDPSASLNPRRSVHQIIGDAMLRHRIVKPSELNEAVREQLERVGLTPAGSYMERLPSQLSGGQQQRVAIARAFSIRPQLVVADEALSSLDHSIQADVLELMQHLKDETGVGYLFISHDIRTTRAFCDRVYVMNNASIVETGNAQEVLTNPQTAYAKSLIAASFIRGSHPVTHEYRKENSDDISTIGN